MTIFEAPAYDPRREKRKKTIIALVVAVIIIAAVLIWLNRYWPEEHVVDNFFSALQHKDFEKAYGIWMADPHWKEHTQKFTQYPFNQFVLDWGPTGDWGEIKSYHIDGADSPPGPSSGVVVVVTVNGRADKARVWVQKKDKSLTFSPF